MVNPNLFEEPRNFTLQEFLQLEPGDIIFYDGNLSEVTSVKKLPVYEVHIRDYSGYHFYISNLGNCDYLLRKIKI